MLPEIRTWSAPVIASFFWNNQVDREFYGVMETILKVLDKHPIRLAPGQTRREPPSPEGEG